MTYSICFFPLVGAVIGAILIIWYYISAFLQINNIAFAAVCAVLPTLISGGFHMDGFCDTTDALSSYQPIQRKLEILKDSNVGAFAVIKTCVFYILYFTAFTQVDFFGICIIALGYTLSRALSGICVVNFKCANGSGLAATFKNATHKRNASIILSLIIIFAIIGMVVINPAIGGICAISAMLTLIYYRVMSYKLFGGITGDIAGYFLILCELYMAISVFLGECAIERIMTIWSL